MADAIEITCVSKGLVGGHPGITHVGNGRDRWATADVIAQIAANSHIYFIKVEQRRSELGLWRGGGPVCLRGHAYGMWNDDLLLLPAYG